MDFCMYWMKQAQHSIIEIDNICTVQVLTPMTPALCSHVQFYMVVKGEPCVLTVLLPELNMLNFTNGVLEGRTRAYCIIVRILQTGPLSIILITG